MDPEQATAWLSEARLAAFRSGVVTSEAAVELHAWHIDLAAALFRMLHCTEVLVRNAIDRALGECQPQAPLRETWMLDLDALRPHALRQVVTAIERTRCERPLTRSVVLAHLPFGFWTRLLDRTYEQLWRDRLHRAFPSGSPSRSDVGRRMRAIHDLRNRVAHHALLLDQDIAGRVDDMLTVAGWVDPAARAWLREVADLEPVLARRP